eukprot:gene41156-50214_t
MDAPISVEQAMKLVLEHTLPLPVAEYSLQDPYLLGSILAEDIVSSVCIPEAPTSIMDGYAVVAPLQPGVYNVDKEVFAGDEPLSQESSAVSSVFYIATGGVLPPHCNAVVKVEDTAAAEGGAVRINVSAQPGQHVRQPGSDIDIGETVLPAGCAFHAAEVGLLSSVGVGAARCFRRPVVGVLSTGNELVDTAKHGAAPLRTGQV